MAMRIYTVHERSGAKGARQVELVREGFSWAALLFPPFWALWYRMWPVAFLLLGAYLALAYLPEWVAGGEAWARLGTGTLMAVAGFLAGDLRQWMLKLRGFAQTGVVAAENLAEAERRLFAAMGPGFF